MNKKLIIILTSIIVLLLVIGITIYALTSDDEVKIVKSDDITNNTPDTDKEAQASEPVDKALADNNLVETIPLKEVKDEVKPVDTPKDETECPKDTDTRKYICDADGNVIKREDYGADGNLRGYNKSEYNADGNRIKRERYNANDRLIGAEWYDADGNVIKYEEYYADGNSQGYVQYEYNADGNLIKAEYYSGGILIGTEHYDADGDLVNTQSY
ncbi:MAG: hypothetical protein OXF49_01275 [Candidatus Saccharibacteria bacterium]|nr:hypothetical protein [Candidatus Saccharibacteria bacterium]